MYNIVSKFMYCTLSSNQRAGFRCPLSWFPRVMSTRKKRKMTPKGSNLLTKGNNLTAASALTGSNLLLSPALMVQVAE
jgi:hypothetical protein